MAQGEGILLQSGTNELEFVEFRVNEMSCGVNVAKVKEIIRKPEIVHDVVGKPSTIAGMISLRDKVLTVIDLAAVLGMESEAKADKILVLEFNKTTVGVMVSEVSRIYRRSWAEIDPPNAMASGAFVTGLVRMEDRIILMLDFERILAEYFEEGAIKELNGDEMEAAGVEGKKILVVDDSMFIRKQISTTLLGAGYDVETAINGEEAWEYIERSLAGGTFTVDAIITDVEMPKMDGLHLVTLIRGTPALENIPVFVFSSLASEDNIRKWDNLGINRILTKPDMPMLVHIVGEALA